NTRRSDISTIWPILKTSSTSLLMAIKSDLFPLIGKKNGTGENKRKQTGNKRGKQTRETNGTDLFNLLPVSPCPSRARQRWTPGRQRERIYLVSRPRPIAIRSTASATTRPAPAPPATAWS